MVPDSSIDRNESQVLEGQIQISPLPSSKSLIPREHQHSTALNSKAHLFGQVGRTRDSSHDLPNQVSSLILQRQVESESEPVK